MVTAQIRSRLALANALGSAAGAGALAAIALASLPAQAAYVAESRGTVQVAAATLRDRLAATGDAGSFVVAASDGLQAPNADALVPTIVTPAPEPETYALMLAGLGVVGWAARRRRSR